MNITFPEISVLSYKSPSQRVRVLSELWMKNEMYCPSCGYERLHKLPNNAAAADFVCEACGEIYELKSKGSRIGKSILDGAYHTALERICGNSNPNLFVMRYNVNVVEELVIVPKYFFTPDVLKIRHALSNNARRAGYVGSMIMYSEIPDSGKISVVRNHTELDKNFVIESYANTVRLKVKNIALRGWLIDVTKCVERIRHEIFSLNDVYSFADELERKHPDNHNVKAKIRQQLQYLRKKGFIEFLGNGLYRKILCSHNGSDIIQS